MTGVTGMAGMTGLEFICDCPDAAHGSDDAGDDNAANPATFAADAGGIGIHLAAPANVVWCSSRGAER